MTVFLLIRHGLHELGGDRIAGRMPGVHLSAAGRRQADRVAERLANLRVDAIYSSPIERTLETAAPLAARHRLEVQVCDDLTEIDFGRWTGAALDDLRGTDEWRNWNEFRSGQSALGGESMFDVQNRFVSRMCRLRDERPHDCIALVSHGDVIKAAIAHFVGSPLDLFQRIEISTASVSVVELTDQGPRVLAVNATDTVDDLPVVPT